MYIPLKITTDYSLLKSMIKIDSLIAFLVQNKISACAIVDENLFGCMEFYLKCKKNKIKPIIGLEVQYQEKPLYFYAKNYAGFQQLLKLQLIKEEKELALEDLQKINTNILVIVPFSSQELYLDMRDIFADTFLGYSNEQEKQTIEKTTSSVYVPNIRALTKEELPYLHYLEAIRRDAKITEIEKTEEASIFIKDVKKEEIDSTLQIASLLNVEIPEYKNHIPLYRSNETESSASFLRNLSLKGLRKRLNGEVPLEYQKRLEYELEVIEKMGFCDYILIVYDYVLYAKKNHIFVGPGRGSAAGSLVCYSVGITDINPLKYQLLFERFLNPERITMPDIDIDFENRRREEIISYIEERYGKQNVASIISFSTLKSKLVLKELGRIHPNPSKSFETLLNEVSSKYTLQENLQNEKVKKILEQDSHLKQLYQDGLRLEGLKKNISKHAAGVVICDTPLSELIPVFKNFDGTLTTGITKDYLEELGLLKMDLLAIENLTTISNILELIKNETKLAINLNRISLEDKEVLQVFTTANTSGVFQFESVGMKSFLQKLKPRCFSDLVAALALYRPGPMDNIDTFIRRKEGKEKITYLAPSLEPILKETEGIIVYQEQVMQILVSVGNYRFSEADIIRRAMSKKNKTVILNEETRFIEKAKENGYEEQTSRALYQLILKFAGYGFNKSHSVAYALVGYWMAYLKVKFPLYFLLNLLNTSIGSEEKTKEYLQLAKSMHLHLVHPNVNHSFTTYKVSQENLILPLTIIKGVNGVTIENIIKEREENGNFKDFIDFIKRMYSKNLNNRLVDLLISAGALRDFGNVTTLKENMENVFTFAKLSEGIDDSLLLKPVIVEVEETADLLGLELLSYGFYITNHPTSIYTDSHIMKLDKIEQYFDQYVRVVVLIDSIRETKTKKGDKMAFLSGSDETGSCSFVIFAKQMNLLTNIQKKDIVEIQGHVTKRYDQYQLNVNNIVKK